MSLIEGGDGPILDSKPLLCFPVPVLAEITSRLPDYCVSKLLIVGNRKLSALLVHGGVESLKFREFSSSSSWLVSCFPRLLSIEYSGVNLGSLDKTNVKAVIERLPSSLKDLQLRSDSQDYLALSRFPNLAKLYLTFNIGSGAAYPHIDLFVGGPPLVDLRFSHRIPVSIISTLPTSLVTLSIYVDYTYGSKSPVFPSEPVFEAMTTLILITPEVLHSLEQFPPNLTDLRLIPKRCDQKHGRGTHKIDLPPGLVFFRFISLSNHFPSSFFVHLPRTLRTLDLVCSGIHHEPFAADLVHLPPTLTDFEFSGLLLTPDMVSQLPPSLTRLSACVTTYCLITNVLPPSLRQFSLGDSISRYSGSLSPFPPSLTSLGPIQMTLSDIQDCWPSIQGKKTTKTLENLDLILRDLHASSTLPNLPKHLKSLKLTISGYLKLSGLPRKLKSLYIRKVFNSSFTSVPPSWFNDIHGTKLETLTIDGIAAPLSLLDRLSSDFPYLVSLSLTCEVSPSEFMERIPKHVLVLSIAVESVITDWKAIMTRLPKKLESLTMTHLHHQMGPPFPESLLPILPISLSSISLPCTVPSLPCFKR